MRLTFEEGTWAAWLYDLLKPHVSEVVVCNPRKNALLKEGNKSDWIDARKLAELLRGNHLKPVLSRRARLAHIERAGTQLSDHHQGCRAGQLLRRSISRRSIHRTSQAPAFSTRVSEATLCLLGQSNKAIGHESQIGPCVATHPVDNHQACCFRKRWAPSRQRNGTTGRGSVSPLHTRRRNRTLGRRKTTLGGGVPAQTNGADAATRMDGIEPMGEVFS